jgi:hypothetical protein
MRQRNSAPSATSQRFIMSQGGYKSGTRIISVKVNRSAMAMQFASILADEKVQVFLAACMCDLTLH